MEQHGEPIKHVKPIASDARNGETCTTPEIVWFEHGACEEETF